MEEKGLRRFRATLAEVEEISLICPKCDAILVPAPNCIDTSQPGGIAVRLSYSYCQRCKCYYIGGNKMPPDEE